MVLLYQQISTCLSLTYPESEVQQLMSGDTFAKMMDWISAFVAKMVNLFKQLGEIFSV